MKNIIISLTLLLFSFASVYSQASNDSINLKKVIGGYQYFQGSEVFTLNEIAQVLKPNTAAYEEIKRAQTTNTIASVFGFAGGFLIGWPLGTAVGGGEANWALAGIGAGIVVIAIPINIKSNKQAKNAIDIYNSGLNKTSFWQNKEFKISSSIHGLTICMTF
jgi:hypothetical protein